MDEVRTYDEVARWLPRDVRRELEMSLSPQQRGWWTPAEAEADGGRFVEGIHMGHSEIRCYRVG